MAELAVGIMIAMIINALVELIELFWVRQW